MEFNTFLTYLWATNDITNITLNDDMCACVLLRHIQYCS